MTDRRPIHTQTGIPDRKVSSPSGISQPYNSLMHKSCTFYSFYPVLRILRVICTNKKFKKKQKKNKTIRPLKKFSHKFYRMSFKKISEKKISTKNIHNSVYYLCVLFRPWRSDRAYSFLTVCCLFALLFVKWRALNVC